MAAYMTSLSRTPSAGGHTVLGAGQQPINVARSLSAPAVGTNGTNHGIPILTPHVLSPPTQYLPVAGITQLQQQPPNTTLVTLGQPPVQTLIQTSPQSQAQPLLQSTAMPPPQQQHAQKQTLTTKQQQMLAQAEESRRNYAKRRKVSHACVYCRRSHMTCDEGRPCQRCIKRKIAHKCHDSVPTEGSHAHSQHIDNSTTDAALTPPPSGVPGSEGSGVVQSLSSNDATLAAAGAALSSAQSSLAQDLQSLTSTPVIDTASYTFPPISPFPAYFANEFAGNEYSILTEFLAGLDSTFQSQMGPMAVPGVAMNGPGAQSQIQQQQQPSLATSSAVPPQQVQSQQPAATQPGPPPITPPIRSNLPSDPTLSATEKFLITAADPGFDGPSPTSISYHDRLSTVLNAKFEAGLLKPYNYVSSYTRLQRYMDTHMSPPSRQRILSILSLFRPQFRSVAQCLTDIDLVLVEEAFERLLLDYDRVFSSMGIPAALWRRTGEIYKVNREFCSLVGVGMEELREGRRCIYELMSEESAVNYWEKYGSIAFDADQKAVLTS
ncbi:hypothetical protein HK097_006024, partial [Rhizophlyctis rosea]